MAPQKGKQGTKGSKQIVEENVATLAFYRNMCLAASVLHLSIVYFLFYDSLTSGLICLMVLCTTIYLVCYNLMKYAAKTQYSETGQLLDSGVDLNMEGGMAEHVKDAIILTAGSQVLSLVSGYFWLLLLLGPIRGGHMLWRSVLAPYFFQEAPQEPEMDDKKRKKMERKMQRMQRK